MDGKEKKDRYVCCFCDVVIVSCNGNPMEIDMLINFDKPKQKQERQAFYCHMECFKEQLNDDFKIHFHLDSFISLE